MNEYVGVISNYNTGLHKQRTDRCLIKIKNVNSREAKKLIGYRVFWPRLNPILEGKILKKHGSTGTLIAKFKKGIPGQALSTEVKIIK